MRGLSSSEVAWVRSVALASWSTSRRLNVAVAGAEGGFSVNPASETPATPATVTSPSMKGLGVGGRDRPAATVGPPQDSMMIPAWAGPSRSGVASG